MIGIYCIENTLNGNVYIGQAVDIKKRWAQHKCDLKAGRHDNKHLQRAWMKYGADAFAFSVIQEAEVEALDDLEMMYIDYFDSFRNGYNMTKGGGSVRGLIPWNKGKPWSDSVKATLSDHAKQRTGEKNAFYGKHHTDKTRTALSRTRSIPVEDIDSGTIYPSAKAADIFFGGKSSNISKALKGKCKTAYGRRWRYADR